MIQIKHRLRKGGDLSDTSTDLWRTIKSWIDAVNGNPQLVQTTRFLIITTATAPEGSAASKMKSDERDIAGIYNQLKEICIAAGNKEHEKFYQSYMACNESTVKSILKKITVIDDADRIDNVEKNILRYIRLSCLPKYERLLFSAIHNYELTAKRDFPFPLIYLVLPLVLHRATREKINSGTQLLAWIQSNPELLVCFPQRASDLVPITNEAVELLLQAGSIAITPSGELQTVKNKRTLSITRFADSEVKQCINKSEHVARWFAKAGRVETIYIGLGVRP